VDRDQEAYQWGSYIVLKGDVSKDKSCDLEAHDKSTWVGGMGTEGT